MIISLKEHQLDGDHVNFDHDQYFENDPIHYNIIQADLVDRDYSEQISDDQESGKILPEIDDKKEEKASGEHSASRFIFS